MSSGLTIIELLIVIAVISVLVTVATPGFKEFRSNYLLKTAARDFFSHIQKMKQVAIKNNNLCTITFNQPVTSENKVYDYVIFTDTDKDLEYDSGEEIIVKKLFTDYGHTTFNLNKGGGDGLTFAKNDDKLPCIAFQASGIPVSNSGSFAQGSVYLKDNYNNTKRIVISQAGNIRIE